MKQFIDKLIERLEELQKLNYEAYETAQWNNDKIMYINASNAYANAITEVNQLAEEYTGKNCSECTRRKWYQIGYADAEKKIAEEYNNGWIPVSSGNLPDDRQKVLCSYENYIFVADYRLADKINKNDGYETSVIRSDGFYKLVGTAYGYCKKDVTAWMPLPAPYQPKGENNGI